VGPKGSLEGWQEGEGVFYTVPPKHLIKLLTGERLPFLEIFVLRASFSRRGVYSSLSPQRTFL
jgi:hypothetical protein